MATKRAAKAATAKTPRKPARARPTAYTPELFAAICAGLAEGKSLVKVCKAAGMPSRQTVHRWLHDDAGLQESYAAARDDQADYLAEEIVDIADGLTRHPNGRKRTPSKEEIAAARLQADVRKWYAGKVRPKKWGDKIDVNVDARVSPLESMSDEELDAEIARADQALRDMGVGLAIGAAAGIAASKAGDDSAAG